MTDQPEILPSAIIEDDKKLKSDWKYVLDSENNYIMKQRMFNFFCEHQKFIERSMNYHGNSTPSPAINQELAEIYDALKSVMELRSVDTLFEAAMDYPHGKEDVQDEIAALYKARKALEKHAAAAKRGEG